MSQRPPLAQGDSRRDVVGVIQDALDRVLPAAERINAGANRGTYGPRTVTAVKAFQRSAGIADDGEVGRNTLRALDAKLIELGGEVPAPEPPVTGIDRILEIAADSAIARYRWRDRGRAPRGYTKGMALVFARMYCKLKAGDAAALEMAKADRNQPTRDALSHYRSQFQALGMDNSSDGVDTLRHLFVLLLGLGMRESSGAHCEGRDMSTDNTSADSAEAGLFQTSWNARTAHPLMPQVFQSYLANPEGFVDVFGEDVVCSTGDWQNHGTGTGVEFQRLSKECPAFAAEFAAIGLRNIRRHWGPINTRSAEVLRDADDMFKLVQDEVDASGLCPVVV
jgi:peptidoglycan hydrolase-like protein with peptidoglycan-binding domain